MENESKTLALCKRAKSISEQIIGITDEKINAALLNIAASLEKNKDKILSANAEDMRRAEGVIAPVMLDRLRLTEERISGMADGIREIAELPSPLYRTLESVVRPNGLKIDKVSVPLGVVAIIYESRPNVTSDAAALCLKSGNVSILKSGKDAFLSSKAIVDAIHEGLRESGLPEGCVNLVEDTTRVGATELMRANGLVDLLIPRGGKGLIKACVENSTVPCLETGTGICHIFIDKTAKPDMALDILENAKTQRPSTCNSAEVCLVHKDIADSILPMIKERLTEKRSKAGLPAVELILDERAIKIIDGTPLGDDDFDTEFLDYRLAIGVVDSINGAIEHISLHSTHHSDAIITEDAAAAELFTTKVDSAAVYVNASTRFTDGGEFGLGCEMGISTQKLHARGPMGIREMTTYKYIVRGVGQTR
jgi:glutamate-5-semialdehyde dehydrogenase